LVEGVETVLLVTLVERVIDDGASSTSTHLLEGSIGGTTSTSNEGNDTNNDTGNDTSRKRGGNNDRSRNDACPILLDALLLFLAARDGAAICRLRRGGIVAAQGLIVAALERDANSNGTEGCIIWAGNVLRDTTVESAIVVLARILKVAGNVIGCVHAVTSIRIADVIGTTNAIVAGLLSSLASSSLVVARRWDALVRRITSNWGMRANSSIANINGASIVVVAVNRVLLTTTGWVTGGGEAKIRGITVSGDWFAMIRGR